MKYKEVVYSIILLMLFILMTIILKYYMQPIIVTAILILISLPIYKLLIKNNFGERISALISIIFINSILIFLLYIMGNVFVNYSNNLIKNGLDQFIIDIINVYNKLNPFKDIDIITMKQEILYLFKKIFNSGIVTKGAVYTTEQILIYFIGNITAYFVLADIKGIFNFIKVILGEKNYFILLKKAFELKNLLKIMVFSVAINVILVILGLYILGLENSVLLGIFCGILDIIPYVGTFIIFVPLIIYYLLKGKYIISFGILALYILLMINTQLIQTKFMSNKLKIQPLPMILAIYVGMKNFGVIGMVMGVLYVITVSEFVFNYNDNKEFIT